MTEKKIQWKPLAMLWLRRTVPVLVAIGCWELAVRLRLAPPYLLPSPKAVVETWMRLFRGEAVGMAPLLRDVGLSLGRQLNGFGLAVLVAIPLGFLLGAFRRWTESLYILLQFIYPIPTLAWIPLALLWFGPGRNSILFIAFMSAFWPAFFNTFDGVRNLNRMHVRVARIFGATPIDYFFRVAIPGSLPAIVTGLRLSYGACWRMLVAAEILLATSGLGYVINQSRSMLRTDQVIAGIATIGILGYLIERLGFTVLETLTINRWGIQSDKAR